MNLLLEVNLSLEGGAIHLGAHETRHIHPLIMALTPPLPHPHIHPPRPQTQLKIIRGASTHFTPSLIALSPDDRRPMAFNQLHQDIFIRGHPHSPSFCSIKQISQAPTRCILSFFVTVAYALDCTGRHRSMRLPSPLAIDLIILFLFLLLFQTQIVFVL